MFRYKKSVSILLIILILLTGIIGTAYANDNKNVTEKTATKEDITNINKVLNDSTKNTDNKSVKDEDNSNELRNGDLTKDSKYPFYDELNILSDETKKHNPKYK